MKIFVVFLLLVSVSLGCDSEQNRAKDYAQVLEQSEGSEFINMHLLVLEPDSLTPKRVIDIAQAHCGTNCNQVYFWKDRKAYELLKEKRTRFVSMDTKAQENEWRKEHWPTVCENLLYTYGQGDVSYYPYLDEAYRQAGGKMKRPEAL